MLLAQGPPWENAPAECGRERRPIQSGAMPSPATLQLMDWVHSTRTIHHRSLNIAPRIRSHKSRSVALQQG